MSEKTISASESDGITQDGTAGRVSYMVMSPRFILSVWETTHRGRDQHLQPEALSPQPADRRKAQDYLCHHIIFLRCQRFQDLSSIQGRWKMLDNIIEQRHENNSNLLLRPKNFLKSFNEQTPQLRLCSRPMISFTRMMAGIPRAPKAAAGSAVLHSNISTSHETDTSEVLTRFGERWQDLHLGTVHHPDAGNLRRSTLYDLGLCS